MKRLFKYVWKYKLLVIIPTIAMLISVILDMFNPQFTKMMVDDVIRKNKISMLPTILLGIAVVTILRSALGYVKEFVSDYLSTEVCRDMKIDLFNHIETLSFSYFDSMNTGELMSRIGEDVDNVWRTIGFGLRLFVENIIYFVLITIILMRLNWVLALISLSIMIPIAYIAVRLEKESDKIYGKISDKTAVLNTTAQEDISGIRLVKAFAREKHEITKFLHLNNDNYKLNVEQTRIMAKYYPAIELLTNISTVAVICIGGVFVIKNKISLGDLVAFSSYIAMLAGPMRMLGFLTSILAQNRASAKRIFHILDTKAVITSKDNAVMLDKVDGEICFKNVNFSYGKEVVLKDINLNIKAGSTVAIMGTTGSGKSSIINLIGRYYDITEGSLTINGHDIKDINVQSLRDKMAVVSQDIFLFSDSVTDNIKLGKLNATEEEIVAVSKEACAYDFITNLEDGYDTIIGERGIGLSGGQKQRISIARALIKNSDILVLDDATSALDMETEYTLLKNLDNRPKKPTTFIIAHRISAVKNADIILYLENGSIVERGTHSELLAKKGKYYEIYCEQFKDFENLESEVV